MEDWEDNVDPVPQSAYSALTNGNETKTWNSFYSDRPSDSQNDNESSWSSNVRGGFSNQRGGRGSQRGGGGGGGFRNFNFAGYRGSSSFESCSEQERGFRRVESGGRGAFREDNSGRSSFSDEFGGRSGGFGNILCAEEDRGGVRFGRGRSRGGYRGRDEEVCAEKASFRSEKGIEDAEKAAPKVNYVPPPPPEDEDSIFSHYETGINFAKYDEILVEVSGANPPMAVLGKKVNKALVLFFEDWSFKIVYRKKGAAVPLAQMEKTFDEAGLCNTLSTNVSRSGYVKPTPVQKYGIPIIMSGRDLMACAQTGSGKTAAFLLPILQKMMADGVAASRFSEVQEPEAIIVAPTRELINQIYLEARKFAYGTCVRPVVVYGGISTGYSIREVLKGCNVLCGTPGRLLDIIGRGKVALSKVRYLVLDEADRMLDMGFEPAMRRLVASPGMPPKEDRQTLMFSATYPDEIQRLAAEFLKTDYLFLVVGQVGGACTDVEQYVEQVTQFEKREKLVEILQTTGNERTMVFVDTKRKADFIATFLCQEKIPTTSIHGDREQREREQALGDFRTGKCPVLVATSVAARGLDIEHVQHVVNFDLPSSIDEYVHRIGRTGRCGNTGKAVSFFDPNYDTPLARSLVKVLSDAQQEVPSWLEEIAFSARGTCGYNPRGNVFASVDTRKASFAKEVARPTTINEPNVEEDWE